MSRPYNPLARLSDDAPAALVEGQPRSGGRLCSDAARIRGLLPAPKPGDEVLVLCADRYNFLTATLAAWSAGYIVALPPNAQNETVRELSQGASVRLLLHDGEWREG